MRRQLLTVGFLTALSQAAAFFKLWFVARIFGIGSELDGYNLALVAPTFIASIASGLIQTGFFPVRSAYKVESTEGSLVQFERTMLWVSVGIGAIATLLVVLGSPWLSSHLAATAHPNVLGTVEFILPYVALLIVLSIVTDCMGYVLAMRDKFVYAAAAPIINGLLGALLLIIWPEYGLQSLVAGTILGVIAQLSICVLGLKSVGFIFFGPMQPKLDFKPLAKRMLRLGMWMLPGVVVSNITASLPMVWAARFGEGVASSFGYAYRLHTSIVQLLVMATSTIILAHFSTLVANNDMVLIRKFLINSALLSFGLGVLGVVAVWFLGTPVLANLFAGRFDVLAAEKVTALWAWLSMGLAFSLLGNVFAKLWQAQGRPRLMSAMSAMSLLVLCLSFYLSKEVLQENSIGLALSLASASVVVVGLGFLNSPKTKKIEIKI